MSDQERTPGRPRYTKLFWKELIADTQHLSAAQFGAYVRLLAHAVMCSDDFCSIPDVSSKQSHITGVDPRNWARIGPDVRRLFRDAVSGRCIQGRLAEDASAWLQHCADQRLRRTGGPPGDDRRSLENRPASRERALREKSEVRSQKGLEPNPPTPRAASGGMGPASRNGSNPDHVPIPDWLPPELWADWCSFRRATRAPWTPKAATLSISRLTTLRAEGFDPRVVIEQSILNGWRGLFQVRTDLPARNGHDPNTDPDDTGFTRRQALVEQKLEEARRAQTRES